MQEGEKGGGRLVTTEERRMKAMNNAFGAAKLLSDPKVYADFLATVEPQLNEKAFTDLCKKQGLDLKQITKLWVLIKHEVETKDQAGGICW